MHPINYEVKKETTVFSDIGTIWKGDMEDKPEIERDLFRFQDKFYREKNPIKNRIANIFKFR